VFAERVAPGGLVVDANNVYWSTFGYRLTHTASVGDAPTVVTHPPTAAALLLAYERVRLRRRRLQGPARAGGRRPRLHRQRERHLLGLRRHAARAPP
jgi:hypothetical protein